MRGFRGFSLFLLFAAACGGSKKPAEQPEQDRIAPPPPPPHEETDADRAKKRHDAALALVPAGSTCLPAAVKSDAGLHLELAGEGQDAVLCASDTDQTRLLGEVACWTVDLKNLDAKTNTVGLVPQDPAQPLPGHDLDAKIIGQCAWGYCLPDKAPTNNVAHLSWSPDGKTVALLVDGVVHIFDAAGKTHTSSFPITGDKGIATEGVAVFNTGDFVFVEGRGDGADGVWGFKADGTPTGPIDALGGKDEKPVSIMKGSFSLLDPTHIGLADHGLATLTNYEIGTGKRTKAVRKTKLPCKPAEIENYWKDAGDVGDKCRAALDKDASVFVGASGVMGRSNLLFVLRGDRLGELAILDPHSLGESKKSLHLPWCDASGGAAPTAAPTAPAPTDQAAPTTRGPQTKKSSDPEEGGQ